MATPETWEATTPVYGIRYPKANAPANKLPTAFDHLATDLDAALEAAEVPPVTEAPIIVAGSASARDTAWGAPTSAADQLALQNKGATTIRTDVGWTERYYAKRDASNQGGAAVAGWFPLDGVGLPTLQHYATAALACPQGNWIQCTSGMFAAAPQINIGGFTFASDAWTVPIAGRYLIAAAFGAEAGGSTSTRRVNVTKNSTDPATGRIAYAESYSPAGVTVSSVQPLAAGDLLRMFGLAGSAVNSQVNGQPPRLELRYLGPA